MLKKKDMSRHTQNRTGVRLSMVVKRAGAACPHITHMKKEQVLPMVWNSSRKKPPQSSDEDWQTSI